MKILLPVFLSLVGISLLAEEMVRVHENIEDLERNLTAYCISFIIIGMSLFVLGIVRESSMSFFLSALSLGNGYILPHILQYGGYRS